MPDHIVEENDKKWKSPLTPQDIARKTISFGDINIDQGKIYWSESRPWEQGCSFIVSYDVNGKITDETSDIYNVSTGVHGYGGGAFIVKDNIIYFTDGTKNQVYKKNLNDNSIIQITTDEGFSYADFSVDHKHKYLYCLRLNKKEELKFPVTQIVRIEIQTKTQEVIVCGADFYSNIRVSSDGSKLLFLQWNYPSMPWDENELWAADIDSNFNVTNFKKVFHKSRVSIYQPEWKNNKIYCAVDINNYWNICDIDEGELTVLFHYPADFARPLWVAGTRTFSFISDHEIVANCCEKGIWKTFVLDIKNNSQILLDNKLTCFYNMAADKNTIAYIGGNETLPLSVLSSSVLSKDKTHILKSTIDSIIPNDFISTPQLIEFKSLNKEVYAFYYEPKNLHHRKSEGNKPPCIIKIHGGPTTSADFMFNPKIQFYTTRGYAYVEINYGGSSGYGREYRERLNKMWGIVDVEDCIACAKFLCANGFVDKNKLIVTGGSSGGFTLLNTLIKTDIFKRASCHYGICDLIELSHHIHKFEACYDQNLIGDTIQNNPNVYKERSPIHYAQNITCPVIFFHGDKDPVVHMDQTIKMAAALKEQNVYHEVHIFENEKHGFKREETIIAVLENELKFFG